MERARRRGRMGVACAARPCPVQTMPWSRQTAEPLPRRGTGPRLPRASARPQLPSPRLEGQDSPPTLSARGLGSPPRSQNGGWALEVSLERAVFPGRCWGRDRGTGPVPAPDRVRGAGIRVAELNGVDFGEDRAGGKGQTGSWSLELRPLPEPRPRSPPFGFRGGPLPVLRDRAGLGWVALGAARPAGVEMVFDSSLPSWPFSFGPWT